MREERSCSLGETQPHATRALRRPPLRTGSTVTHPRRDVGLRQQSRPRRVVRRGKDTLGASSEAEAPAHPKKLHRGQCQLRREHRH